MDSKKKVAKKTVAKKTVKHEIVVRVAPQLTPTVSELAEPMRDGKKLTIPKTWVSEGQLNKILQVTPKNHVYSRKGRGGQMFQYVTGAYVTKALNYIFGWNWDFEIVQQGREGSQVWVLGKLIVRGANSGEQIIKTQFGRADIKFMRDTKDPVDFGNDLKAATTDAMKKCASLLGIASDIYGKMDYKQEAERDPIEQPAPQLHPEEVQIVPVNDEYYCKGVDGKGCAYGTAEISKAEHDYSMKLYKKPLCLSCQGDAKK